MRILLATDAWAPQVNGVVRTWQHVIRELESMGHEVAVAHPGLGRTMAAPRYQEIRLALRPGRIVRDVGAAFAPQAIHVATEGPIGMAAARWCRARGVPFTTSYHTQFPQYLRRFHGRAARTFAPTRAITDELHARGIPRATTWCRGVDCVVFRPDDCEPYAGLARPIALYAGRVAVEKNIEAFLDADLPGTKVIVGDGPLRERLARTRRDVVFAGYRFGADLARHYAGADVFVFPSRTDTFGIVMLEANACGVPVAAYPVCGPIDVVKPGVNGWLDEDLATAVRGALTVERAACLAHARANSWRRCAEMLFDGLAVA